MQSAGSAQKVQVLNCRSGCRASLSKHKTCRRRDQLSDKKRRQVMRSGCVCGVALAPAEQNSRELVVRMKRKNSRRRFREGAPRPNTTNRPMPQPAILIMPTPSRVSVAEEGSAATRKDGWTIL